MKCFECGVVGQTPRLSAHTAGGNSGTDQAGQAPAGSVATTAPVAAAARGKGGAGTLALPLAFDYVFPAQQIVFFFK